MNTIRNIALAAAICLPLLACTDKQPTSANADPKSATVLGRVVKQATDEARHKLATENISLDAVGQPKAEISPQGDLLIGGENIPVTAEQRALLLEYRKHVVLVAEAGIGVGLQGADLAGKAVTEAIKGVFTGNADQAERKIEAEAEQIKASGMKLCELLPAMLATQNKLAAALPEFTPYAKMDQTDIDDCGKNHGDRSQVREEVRENIRNEIRSSIQAAVKGARTADSNDDTRIDAAKEAEMASAEESK